LPKAKAYDADIFVRFSATQKDLSDSLEKVLKKIANNMNLPLRRVHGSRDYFNLPINKQLTLEVIPVLKVRNVAQAQNITDLSYFHVAYVKRKLTASMKREVALAKTFCASNGIYGAESYVRGFSGYGLECLIIYYKTFERMLRDLIKVNNEKKIIDIEKCYKKKEEILIALNESKTQGPIVLVDPTWKERNVLASLDLETFEKFQKKAKEFLQIPSEKYFLERILDRDAFEVESKKKKAEFLSIILETDKQEGDIAGTKMKKFSKLLEKELSVYFEVIKTEFSYDGGKNADCFFIVKKRKEIVKIGPPVKMKKETQRFRNKNKEIFVKNGKLCARVKIDFSGREFLQRWKRSSSGKKVMKDMSILSFVLN
jgi:tRNA nucleotidyltransferase (CCA-adding enzyme)